MLKTALFSVLVLVAGFGSADSSSATKARVLSPAAAKIVQWSPRWRPTKSSGGYELSEPGQHLTAQVTRNRITLISGRDAETLSLVAYSANHIYTALAAGRIIEQNAALLEYDPHGLTVWYRGVARGIEQGFTLDRAPLHTGGELDLTVELRGNLRAYLRTPQDLEFDNAEGKPKLRYSGLFAYDSRHRPLAARMELIGHSLRIKITTQGARYPITVDPLVTSVTQFNDPDNSFGDNFGYSVALSADGSEALVGAFSASANGNDATGKAYIYLKSSGSWSPKPAVTWLDPANQTLDEFGDTVALSASGTTAIVSALSGVYVYSSTGGTWSTSPVAVLTDPTGNSNSFADCFGCSISLSEDGTMALVGAWSTTVNNNSAVGRVYVYSQNNGSWSTAPVAILNAPKTVANDYFGYSVALSSLGNVALVGAPQQFGGLEHAYVFTQKNGVWASSPTATFTDPLSNELDMFGGSVSLSADGTVALVGAYGSENVAGAADLYISSGGLWTTTPTAVFSNPDASGGGAFGFSVALSEDGTGALIGGSGALAGEGAAYVYKQLNGLWYTTPTGDSTLIDAHPVKDGVFGTSVALSSNATTALVGEPETPCSAPAGQPPPCGGPGRAFVFDNSNNWGYGNSGGSSSGGGGGDFNWLSSAILLTILWLAAWIKR